MNGKYYGKREIRWQSREADRLEHIRMVCAMLRKKIEDTVAECAVGGREN